MIYLVIGFVAGFITDRLLPRRTKSDPHNNEETEKLKEKYKKFGPCPNCGVQTNLEEWRCGSCSATLHEM
ncbi:MAG: hypothetical protein P4L61_04180 [Candidatus Pacebacteria bacterium]|nr:hypothetical protein [Candidatus Paceibacterota bacterium]